MPSLHLFPLYSPLHAKSSSVNLRDTHQLNFDEWSFGYTEVVNINEIPWACDDRSEHLFAFLLSTHLLLLLLDIDKNVCQ